MITDEDSRFHLPTGHDPTWAETNYFGFYVPQLRMNCGVYALFRPSLGVVISTVSLNTRHTRAPWEADYWDSQAHVPIPDNCDLRDYSLANGLSVRSPEPNRVWDIRFDDSDGTRLDVRYTALMDPFDIHDPDQDPMVAAKLEGSDFAWGTAYNGHFDQTGLFEGEVNLRGRTTSFTSVSTMDHSWGPRPERSATPMSWLGAHFSPSFAIKGIFDFDPGVDPNGESELRLTHGYVLEDGKAFGLKRGSGRSTRRDFCPVATSITVVDSLDREWTAEGTAATSFPWTAWPDVVGFDVLHDWTCGEQRGLGEAMDFLGNAQLTSTYSRVLG
jgi:hypothetical protein